MSDDSIKLLRDYWFKELGCTDGDIIPNKVAVVSHGTLKGYKGVMFFSYQGACIISAPDDLTHSIAHKVQGLDANSCFSIGAVSSLIGERLDRIVGPAWIGQISRETFRAIQTNESKLLSDGDWESLDGLLRACSEEESAHSALEVGRSPTAGIYQGEHLAAAAGYEILADKVAHIGVLVHPNYRRKGLAKKVVSRITETALKTHLGIQYRTLCSNVSSVGTGNSLGFTKFAETIAARLR